MATTRRYGRPLLPISDVSRLLLSKHIRLGIQRLQKKYREQLLAIPSDLDSILIYIYSESFVENRKFLLAMVKNRRAFLYCSDDPEISKYLSAFQVLDLEMTEKHSSEKEASPPADSPGRNQKSA